MASCAAFASSALPAQQPATGTQPGWNLRWRKSPQVVPQPVHVPKDDVFARPAAQPQPAVLPATNVQPPAVSQMGYQQSRNVFEQTATAQPIRQAAHNETVEKPSGTNPSGNYRRGVAQPTDFFNNPFAANPGTTQGSVTSRSVRIAQQPRLAPQPRLAQAPSPPANGDKPSGGFQLPSLNNDTAAPTTDDLPSNALRGSATGDPAIQSPASPSAAESLGLPSGTPDKPAASEPTLPAPKRETPLRELFEKSNETFQPDEAAKPNDAGAAPPANSDSPEPGKVPSDDSKTDSASDKGGLDQYLYQSPFDLEKADREDTKRLQDAADAGGVAGSQPDPSMKIRVNELSCEDFRGRIARETIDRISLDPSPPFHPELYRSDDYQKERERFLRLQARDWSSIDGRVIANGRWIDLAYEQIIIETEGGEKQELQISSLSEGDLGYLSQHWGLPKECLIEQVAYTPRSWTPLTMTWKASNICSKPRYFEEVNLERYGHTAGPILQPVVSSAHFFANIAVLPYKMGIHPPNECQYALGYYRPGNCAPWIVPPVPISARGALAQAAVMTGAFWLIP